MEEKLRNYRLARERRVRLDPLKRAEEVTHVSNPETNIQDDDTPTEKVMKHKKILDTYRTGNYFAKRSNSAVDLRHESMQTDPELLENYQTTSRKPTRHSIDQIRNSLGRKSNTANVLGFAAPVSRHSFNEVDLKIEKPVIAEDSDKFNIKELQPENQKKILKSDKFNDYFFNASKFVEKILVNEDEHKKKHKANAYNLIQEESKISCPSHLKNTIVNNLNWSYLVPEMFLSTYISKDEDVNISTEPDKIYLWNRNFLERPEFELMSTQKVEKAMFSPFSSELVITGCQSGKICLYDLRAKKEAISKSSPSNESHRSSITGIEFIGSRNSNNLISVSEEGRLCVWSLLNLDSPIRKIDLLPVVHNKPEIDNFDFLIEPFSLSSILGDTSGVFVGGVDGNIYQCTVLSSSSTYQQAKTFLNIYKGHKSIVNCIHHSRASNISSQLSGLMLSGSFDWSVKMWSTRENRLLYDFRSHQDPITDVHWNTNHPAMFASADASGQVKIFNLLKNFDQPVYETSMNGCVFNSKWDAAGETLAISDHNGDVILKHFNTDFFDYKQTDIKVFETSVNSA